jgi:hypothetical protein
MNKLGLALGAVVLFGGADALAYDTAEVKDAGEVTGTITLQGAPPKAPAATMPKDLAPEDRAFCGGKEPLAPPFYVVDGAGHLKDVVVWLDGVAAGKAPAREAKKLANKDCRFGPHVQTMDVGAELVVENHDPILHNTHPVYVGDQSTLFNLAVPPKGQAVKKKVKRAGVLKVQCDAGHVWMRAFVHVFEHPYHVVTAADGSFRLKDVPPGKYTINVWHEASGTQSRPIEITASGKVVADFAMAPKG